MLGPAGRRSGRVVRSPCLRLRHPPRRRWRRWAGTQ